MKKIVIFVLLVLCSINLEHSIYSQTAVTITRADNTVINATPSRMGASMGFDCYYDSCQIYKNLIHAQNPTFEPTRTIDVWIQGAAGTGTGTSASPATNTYTTRNFYINNGGTAVLQSEWAGASDTIVESSTSSLINCTDIVSSANTTSGDNAEGGLVFTFTPGSGGATGTCGNTPAGTVHVITSAIKTPANGSSLSSGVSYTSGGATLTADTATPLDGLVSLHINASVSGSFSSSSFGFDTLLVNRFVSMDGTYTITAKVRSQSGSSGTFTMNLARQVGSGRPAAVNCASPSLPLTTSITTVSWTCTATENTTRPDENPVYLSVIGTNNNFDIDDISVAKTSGQDSTNTSVFRDEYVNGMKAFYGNACGGTLRFGPETQNGETYANWTTPFTSALQTTYSPYGTALPHPTLPDYLALAKLICANPYVAFPMGTTSADAASIERFLFSTNTSDAEVIKRTNIWGHPLPYGGPTGDFPMMYLSFGNEAWNYADGFDGGNMPGTTGPNGYTEYMNHQSTIWSVVRGQTSFPPNYVKLISDVQYQSYYGWTTELAKMAAKGGAPDLAEVSPYIGMPFTSRSTNEAAWRLGISTPYTQINNTNATLQQVVSSIQSQAACGQSGTAVCGVSVYEEGPGDLTSCGSTGYPTCQTSSQNPLIDVQNLQLMNAGAGTGTVFADEYLENLAHGISAQNLFASTQFGTSGAGTNVSGGPPYFAYVWGSVIDYGGAESALDGANVRARPTYLGVQVANNAVIGQMTSCSNNAGTYNQAAGPIPSIVPATNNIPNLQTKCFTDGVGHFSVAIVNRSTTVTYAVSIGGTNSTMGAVTGLQYAPTNLDQLNEIQDAIVPSYSNSIVTPTTNAPKVLSNTAISFTGSNTVNVPPGSVTEITYSLASVVGQIL